MVVSRMLSLHRLSALDGANDCRNNQEREEDKEQNLGDSCCGAGDAGKAE